MDKSSLTELTRHHLDAAREASSGRSAQTVYGGHDNVLRQTLIALRAGASLAEHENPGEATLLVLHGSLALVSAEGTVDGMTGDLLVIPHARHSLEAREDSAILLSVGKQP